MASPLHPSVQTDVLELIWRNFQEHGRWPTFARLDRAVYRVANEELPTILNPVRGSLVNYDTYGTGEVVLTLAGMASCADSYNDLQNLLDAIRWCVARERDHDPTGPDDETIEITQRTLALGVRDARPAALNRLFAIFVSEGLTSGSKGPDPQNPNRWAFLINKRIRRFKDVWSVGDLLAVTGQQPSPVPIWLSTPVPVATDSVSPSMVRLFVLMPFGPTWSTAVYRAIAAGCVAAKDDVQIERADEITETGSITVQIQERIEAADIVVADLTDTNGNVMYEVGYADALKKTIVVINQNVGATPFDLSVHRQIEYALHDLPTLTERVSTFVETALVRRMP